MFGRKTIEREIQKHNLTREVLKPSVRTDNRRGNVMVVEKSVPVKYNTTTIPEDYIELCNQIGFSPGVFEEIRFINFCNENDIPMYDYKKVDNYLRSLLTPGFIVYWTGLRDKDTRPGYICYQKLVPINILRRVAILEKRFPNAFKFFVSEIVHNPDPFLMVRGSSFRHIIGVWNEPGFDSVLD